MGATHFDVAIIGSGIAGSTLGAILARHGMRTVIFEAKSHPRFSIGESMILETSETMRATAELFDVPELAYFSSEHYFGRIGTSHGVKRHFSYLHHTPGQPQDIGRALQAVIPRQPHGHELHIFRQDSDALLTTVAIAYGATVLQETPVRDIQVGEDRVTITTARGQAFTANYVVDAGGYKSLLADKFDLRDHDLLTHSRAIFTHMVGVPDYHDVGADLETYGLPFSVAEGTLHHIFHGGWMWVIPFNNHDKATNPLCSVGLMLDPRIHPVRDDLTPEEEFNAFVAQYPSMAAQFRNARAARPWTRAGRIQYSSKQVVGDRWALLGHAAGFIDPLFSKGLYVTSMTLSCLANLLLDAHASGDYSAAAFQPLEKMTLDYIRANDRLIASSYKSFQNYPLWSVYAVLWMLGAYTEYVKLSSIRALSTDRHDYHARAQQLNLVGGGFPEFGQLAARLDAIMDAVDPADDADVAQATEEMRAILLAVDWMPKAFVDVLHGKNHLPNNKLRPGLLKRDDGFMGHGAFRTHFFEDGSTVELLRKFAGEKVRYSTFNINRQRMHVGRAV